MNLGLAAALLAAFPCRADVHARFEALHGKDDRSGCTALWRADPSSVLPAIEQDLDRALELREAASSKEGAAPDAGKVAEAQKLEQRASWGARIAREALGAPLIADLTAARTGWTERERRLDRDQRAIAARAKASLEKGESLDALEAAQEAVTRALALGDWHATALAYESCGIAHQALSSFDDALVAWSQARVLFHGLLLAGEEETCLRAVLDMCYATERHARGWETADQAAEIARRRGDRPAEAMFLERRAGFEEKLGMAREAQATRGAAKGLERPK